MAVTIKDVAERAGVSPSTVSRVIADSPRISSKTKKRVRASMRELGYHPNAIARSLVRKRSRTIGLIMSRPATAAFSNPFFPEVIRGIGSVAQEFRYSLLLSTSNNPADEREECLAMLHDRRVDGVILLASRLDDQLLEELIDGGHCFVVIGRVPGNLTEYWVNNDNLIAAHQAVSYLISLGHRRIGYLGGPPELIVSVDRLEGYRLALERSGIEFDAGLVRETDFSLDSGYLASRELLSGDSGLTAIFAIDDLLAMGALRAARELDLMVPGDLSIVGFNDDPASALVTPALTTVRIPIFDLGERAARMLIGRLEGEPGNTDVLLPAELVIRDSTAAPNGREG